MLKKECIQLAGGGQSVDDTEMERTPRSGPCRTKHRLIQRNSTREGVRQHTVEGISRTSWVDRLDARGGNAAVPRLVGNQRSKRPTRHHYRADAKVAQATSQHFSRSWILRGESQQQPRLGFIRCKYVDQFQKRTGQRPCRSRIEQRQRPGFPTDSKRGLDDRQRRLELPQHKTGGCHRCGCTGNVFRPKGEIRPGIQSDLILPAHQSHRTTTRAFTREDMHIRTRQSFAGIEIPSHSAKDIRPNCHEQFHPCSLAGGGNRLIRALAPGAQIKQIPDERLSRNQPTWNPDRHAHNEAADNKQMWRLR